MEEYDDLIIDRIQFAENIMDLKCLPEFLS